MNIESLLNKYPKKRPPLTQKHKDIFAKEYKENRDGEGFIRGLAQRAESWMHKQVASHSYNAPTTLEIGAGTLNQLKHEKNNGAYDIIEPFKHLYTNNPKLDQIRHVYDDMGLLPDETHVYDRIISVAVLEHLEELPYNLARSCLLLKKDGSFQAGIPSEGGFLWGLGWRLTTGLGYYLRNKISYKTLMEHEHINDIDEMLNLTRYFFSDVTIHYFPIPGKHLSLYAYIAAKNPNKSRALEYLKSYTPIAISTPKASKKAS